MHRQTLLTKPVQPTPQDDGTPVNKHKATDISTPHHDGLDHNHTIIMHAIWPYGSNPLYSTFTADCDLLC